jgi:hypothetical protein
MSVLLHAGTVFSELRMNKCSVFLGRRSPLFCVRPGHARRPVLDRDRAAQPEARDDRRDPPLFPRSHLRFLSHAACPAPGYHAQRRRERVQQGPANHHDVKQCTFALWYRATKKHLTFNAG